MNKPRAIVLDAIRRRVDISMLRQQGLEFWQIADISQQLIDEGFVEMTGLTLKLTETGERLWTFACRPLLGRETLLVNESSEAHFEPDDIWEVHLPSKAWTAN